MFTPPHYVCGSPKSGSYNSVVILYRNQAVSFRYVLFVILETCTACCVVWVLFIVKGCMVTCYSCLLLRTSFDLWWTLSHLQSCHKFLSLHWFLKYNSSLKTCFNKTSIHLLQIKVMYTKKKLIYLNTSLAF